MVKHNESLIILDLVDPALLKIHALFKNTLCTSDVQVTMYVLVWYMVYSGMVLPRPLGGGGPSYGDTCQIFLRKSGLNLDNKLPRSSLCSC